MTNGDRRSDRVLGFLTVLAHDSLGLVGGYLLLNAAGRPLEFHCTAPVKPNRAQQILFGPTLPAYLYGEQIGQTLVGSASVEPLAVCTDVEQALAVRDFVDLPVALVLGAENENAASDSEPAGIDPAMQASVWRVDGPHQPAGHLTRFTAAGNRLAVARNDDRDVIAAHLQEIGGLDLCEPFGRIREAVEEAHKQSHV